MMVTFTVLSRAMDRGLDVSGICCADGSTPTPPTTVPGVSRGFDVSSIFRGDCTFVVATESKPMTATADRS